MAQSKETKNWINKVADFLASLGQFPSLFEAKSIKQRLFVLLLLITMVIVTVVMSSTQTILYSYSTLRNLVPRGEERVLPDVICCPAPVTGRKYHIYYNSSSLDDTVLDLIINGTKLARFPNKILKMAQKLSVTTGLELLEAVWDKRIYAPYEVDSKEEPRQCKYEPFSCSDRSSSTNIVWLLNSSLCLLWNNTQLWSSKNMYVYKVGNRSEKVPARWWLGNLAFQKITDWNSFTEPVHNLKVSGISYLHKKSVKGSLKICQDQIRPLDHSYSSGFSVSADCREELVHENIWFHNPKRFYEGTSLHLRYENNYHYVFEDRKRFSPMQILSAIGGFSGVTINLSCAQLVMVAFSIWKLSSSSRGRLAVAERVVLLLLLPAFFTYSYFETYAFSKGRYQNDSRLELAEKIPYPTIGLCTDPIFFFRRDQLKKYNVSYILLQYINAALFHKRWEVQGYEDLSKLNNSEEDAYTTFHRLNLFRINPHNADGTIAKRLIAEAENEYRSLAKTLGVDPDGKSSADWLAETFIKDKCTLVETCFNGNKRIDNCCREKIRFAYNTRQMFGCLTFDQTERPIMQTEFRPQTGLRIRLNSRRLFEGWSEPYIGPRLERMFRSQADLPIYQVPRLTFLTSHLRFGLRLQQRIEVDPPFLNRRQVLFKLSAESQLLLPHKPGATCSINPKCFVWRYDTVDHTQLLFKTVCGCHICSPGQQAHYRNPCCSVLEAVDCITRKEWYDQDWCDTWYNYDLNQPTVRAGFGNLQDHALDVHLYYGLPCMVQQWFHDNRSAFYPQLKGRDRLDLDCREPCSSVIFSAEETNVLENESVTDGETEILLYTESRFIVTVEEKDTFNPIIFIALISGSFGMITGLSFLEISRTLAAFAERLKHAKELVKCLKECFVSEEDLKPHSQLSAIFIIATFVAGIIVSASAAVYMQLKEKETAPSHSFSLQPTDTAWPVLGLCTKTDAKSFLFQHSCGTSSNKKKLCKDVFTLKAEGTNHVCYLSNSSELVKNSFIDVVRLNHQPSPILLFVKDWAKISELKPDHAWNVNTSVELWFWGRKRVSNCCESCRKMVPAQIKACSDKPEAMICGLNKEKLRVASDPSIKGADYCTQHAYYTTAVDLEGEGPGYLRVILKTPVMEVFEEAPSLNFVDKVALFGGIQGLFLGISLASLLGALFRYCKVSNTVSPEKEHENKHPADSVPDLNSFHDKAINS